MSEKLPPVIILEWLWSFDNKFSWFPYTWRWLYFTFISAGIFHLTENAGLIVLFFSLLKVLFHFFLVSMLPDDKCIAIWITFLSNASFFLVSKIFLLFLVSRSLIAICLSVDFLLWLVCLFVFSLFLVWYLFSFWISTFLASANSRGFSTTISSNISSAHSHLLLRLLFHKC